MHRNLLAVNTRSIIQRCGGGSPTLQRSFNESAKVERSARQLAGNIRIYDSVIWIVVAFEYLLATSKITMKPGNMQFERVRSEVVARLFPHHHDSKANVAAQKRVRKAATINKRRRIRSEVVILMIEQTRLMRTDLIMQVSDWI